MLYGPPLSSDDEDGLSDDNDYENFKATMRQRKIQQGQNFEVNTEKQKLQSISTAITFGKNEVVLAALSDGFDVNTNLQDGWTPLLLAVCVTNETLVKELLNHGANVNYERDGLTPLMCICDKKIDNLKQEDILNIVKILIENGADPKAQDRKRKTPLMLAAYNNNLKVVQYLLPLSNKSAEDNQRWTAIFWAVEGNAIEVFEYLLNQGYDSSKTDVRGNKLVDLAQQNGFDEIIGMLTSDDPNKDLTFYNSIEYFNEILFEEADRPEFFGDLCKILYGTKSEDLIPLFANKKVSFYDLLSCNEKWLKDIGVKFSFQRRKIMGGLYKFHKYPFHPKSMLALNKKKINSNLEVGSIILTCLKQIIVMEASLQFLTVNCKENLTLISPGEVSTLLTKLKQQTLKLKLVTNYLLQQHQEWDQMLQPADLITKKRRNVPWGKLIVTTSLIICSAICIYKYKTM